MNQPSSSHAQMPAISGVSEPEKIRVVLFINNELVHAPLPALLQQLNQTIADLEARIAALETP